MSGTMKPAAAIFILVIMVLSVAGFALNSANFQKEPEGIDIPAVVREPLSTQDQVYILRTGRVLIEHFYTDGCEDCFEKNAQLEEFAARLDGYVVVNEVAGNESRLDMIGMGGKIVDISNTSLDYEGLIDTFCGIAIAQPRACILRDI
jgi:thiol-disulfide isomerase/thioredoxin